MIRRLSSTIFVIIVIIVSAIPHPSLVDGHTNSRPFMLQKCIPKADMENVSIKCAPNEIIAIKTAYFTSSIVDQCPFAIGTTTTTTTSTTTTTTTTTTAANIITNQTENDYEITNNEIEEKNGIRFNYFDKKLSCIDDLRLTLNSRCSGRDNCSVNLRKAHIHRCDGFDGWINIKYTCVEESHLHPYCNLEMNDRFGFVTNPGYPKFYTPYHCKWKITAAPGQRIQIDILDLSLREPRFVGGGSSSAETAAAVRRRRPLLSPPQYKCIDSMTIIEDGAKVKKLCGEVKSNLIEYRSKTETLTVELVSSEFSPTRGVLFKYSLLHCPTLRAPTNGHMSRNGSFAYYTCHYDYVFEDTGLTDLTLYCEHETYWNGSVARCVPKENVTVMAYALIHGTATNGHHHDSLQQIRATNAALEVAPAAEDGQNDGYIDFPSVARHALQKHFNKGWATPVVLLIVVVLISVCIVVLIVRFRTRSGRRTAV